GRGDDERGESARTWHPGIQMDLSARLRRRLRHLERDRARQFPFFARHPPDRQEGVRHGEHGCGRRVAHRSLFLLPQRRRTWLSGVGYRGRRSARSHDHGRPSIFRRPGKQLRHAFHRDDGGEAARQSRQVRAMHGQWLVCHQTFRRHLFDKTGGKRLAARGSEDLSGRNRLHAASVRYAEAKRPGKGGNLQRHHRPQGQTLRPHRRPHRQQQPLPCQHAGRRRNARPHDARGNARPRRAGEPGRHDQPVPVRLTPRLYMVRHGRAAATFGEAHAPGLDDLGRSQAEEVAKKLAPLGPLAIVSSPLARTRETAAPLARSWNSEPLIKEAVAEIPSPGLDLAERAQWLRKFMAGSWRAATPPLAQWREDVIAALVELKQDTVIFSHYVALNVAIGAATGDDRVTSFSPENCSVTIFETAGEKLALIEKGREAPLTKVN